MATVTGLTAERMLEIEGASVVSGAIDGNGHLILTKFDGTTIDAGPLPPGPQGPSGPAGGQIPGEVKIWPGTALPNPAQWGKWAWADGAVYPVADYPKAAAHIAPEWKTFGGASDPGPGNFRVPDLRGLVPAGMDQMPGGARANRLTRSVSIVIAGKTGEELHTITVAEMANHGHPVTDNGHAHQIAANGGYSDRGAELGISWWHLTAGGGPIAGPSATQNAVTGITIGSSGGGQSHETMQPTVFVPYIVKMDD